MKNILFKQSTLNLAFVVAAALVAAFTAEASPPPENLLVSAGFKVKVAKTVSQRQELETLAKGKLSPVTQNGETFYVYPDVSHNQLYVGDEAQYQTYLDLVATAPSSARLIVNIDDIDATQVKAREFNGWDPFDDSQDN
jgi:hypothetical protein